MTSPPIPPLVYGSAWKEARTRDLTLEAIRAGFRAVDTANQRKHYFEAAVGEAVRQAIHDGIVRREDLFLQTKFTYVNGQDARLPYDPRAPIATQVRQSVTRSLEHLGVERLDGYLLHGPASYPGLVDADWEAWHGMEALHDEGKLDRIGISNVTAQQLEELLDGSTVRPTLVQNRTFTRPDADRAVRGLCKENSIDYEGFSLLTGNRQMLQQPAVRGIARRVGVTVPQLIFRYCIAQGVVVLTGTTDPLHMREDLAAPTVDLSAEDALVLEALDH